MKTVMIPPSWRDAERLARQAAAASREATLHAAMGNRVQASICLSRASRANAGAAAALDAAAAQILGRVDRSEDLVE